MINNECVIYKQPLYLEQLLHLVELEETLESIVGNMIDAEVESKYAKFIKCEIERIKEELGLEE